MILKVKRRSIDKVTSGHLQRVVVLRSGLMWEIEILSGFGLTKSLSLFPGMFIFSFLVVGLLNL